MKIKKLTSLAVALVLAFAFVGCSNSGAGNNADDKDNSTQTQQEDTAKDDNKDEEKDSEDDKDTEEKIVVYSYDVENDKLVANDVSVKKDDAASVFESLKELGVVPKDAKMNSFDITEADGVNTGLLDVSKEFVNNNLGSGPESLMLNAVAQTFIENFDIEQLQLTVDGGDYESGHIILSEGDYLKPERTGPNEGTGEDVEAVEN